MGKRDTTIRLEDFFVARVPQMSIDYIRDLPDEDSALRARLEQWLGEPGVLEALYVASPSLVQRLDRWRRKPESKQGRKATDALTKYLLRMSTRATPFGLFAGVSMGRMDNKTTLTVDGAGPGRRVTRLDRGYLDRLRTALVQSSLDKRSIRLRPNPTLHRVAGRYHYIEPYQSDAGRQYRLSSVMLEEPVHKMIELAGKGSTRDVLATEFAAVFPEADAVEVDEFIDQMLDESLLLHDLPMPVTGSSPDQALLDALEHAGASDAVNSLRQVIAELESMDLAGAAEPESYESVRKILEPLGVNLPASQLFQVDLYRGVRECRLDHRLGLEMAEPLELLQALGQSPSSPLSDFVDRFQSRFEGQMVPLLEALDEESGIAVLSEGGYASPLLAGIRLARGGDGRDRAAISTTPMQQELIAAIFDPANHGRESVSLDTNRLRRRAQSLRRESIKSLPASFAANCSLYETKDDGDPIVHLKGAYGPSAANLLGRFCHLDETLNQSVRDHLQREQDHHEGAILAEIVHLPDGRPGNVITRPCLRDYEITFLGDSGVSDSHQIPVSDLYVYVESGVVKLWSRCLGRQIIPRLSSAHNYSSRSLNIYRFLSLIQNQFVTLPSFEFPPELLSARFLPRITLDSLILSPMKWLVPREEIASLVKDGKWQADAWARLERNYRLKPVVVFAVSDNTLRVDLRNPRLVEMLLAEIQGAGDIPLQEDLSETYRPLVVDPENGRYANEVILPFYNPGARTVFSGHSSQGEKIGQSAARRFGPGSEWLSVKLYGARSSVESVLMEKVAPLISRWRKLKLFDKWFFIRYGDPDWHLRLRFHGNPARLGGELLPELRAALKEASDDGLIHRIEAFTYVRETERYGGDHAIDHAETLFMEDSHMVMDGVALAREHDESLRWRQALLVCDAAMQAFGQDLDARFHLIDRLRMGFGEEFEENASLRSQLGERYRDLRKQIEEDFSDRNTESPAARQMHRVVEHYRASLEPIGKAYSRLEAEGKLVGTIEEVLPSFLHMTCNRLFKSDSRAHEFLVHDLLRRHYLAEINRRRNQSKTRGVAVNE